MDDHNGRFCVTPDYPAGIYSYFVTLDSALDAEYPYTSGPTYYGTIQPGNTGPGSGHNVISEPTIIYVPTGMEELENKIRFQFYPNPTKGFASVYFFPSMENNISATLCNLNSEIIKKFENFQPAVTYTLDFSKIPSGVYVLILQTENTRQVQRLVKVDE